MKRRSLVQRVTDLEQQVDVLTEALKLTFELLDQKLEDVRKPEPLFPDWVERSTPPAWQPSMRCTCLEAWGSVTDKPACPAHGSLDRNVRRIAMNGAEMPDNIFSTDHT